MALDDCEIVHSAIYIPEEGWSEKILMTIDLPQNLMVANGRVIQIRNLTPVKSGGDDAIMYVAVPIRRIAY